MKFYKVNARNYELNVVFNGKMYIFFNGWCGIAAIAERTTPADKIASGEEIFNIKYGNEHLTGGSLGYGAILPLVKRLINKCESKFLPTNVTYTEERCDLSKWYAEIEVKQR